MKFKSQLVPLFLLGASLIGCREVDESISVYTVPKEEKTRLLAALIPHGSQVWIFKANGSDERVQAFEKDFLKFLESVEFGEAPDAEPDWELSEGWAQLSDEHPRNSGRFPRFATVYKRDKDHVERVEIAVTSLPLRRSTSWQQYVKDNVDRWRGQLGLSKVEIFELDQYTEVIELDDGLVATTVNFVEPDKTTPEESEKTQDAPAKKSETEVPFLFEKPEAWSVGPGTTFSVLGFQVEEGGKKVTITVTPAGGDLLANVNRWRGQIGLDPIGQKQLDEEKKELKAGEVSFSYFQLLGEQRATWAAVGSNAGQTWFVTLKGDKDLARRETENFESFVKSIRFKS